MGFDLGAGLAEMGKSVAASAGDAAMNIQKAGLEEDKARLADQLATTRETTLETQRQQGQKDLIPLQTAGQISVNDANVRAQVEAHIQEATADTKEAVSKVKQMATPELLAAQRAITAASTIPNLSVQVKDDGTAMTFNPLSGKTAPIMDPSTNQPIKFQNPATAQAVVQQTMTLKDAGNNLDRMYKSDMDAARVLHKDDSAEDQQKALDKVQSYYRPKIEQVNSQLLSLTSALGVKSGIGATPMMVYDAKGNLVSGGPPAGTGATGLINGGRP